MDCHAFIKARPLCAPHGDDDLNKLCNDRKKFVITSDSEVIHIQKFVNFLNNNVAFPKNAKKYNNNAAFPTGRLWRAHCVHLQIGRKGFPERDAERKPLVICWIATPINWLAHSVRLTAITNFFIPKLLTKFIKML